MEKITQEQYENLKNMQQHVYFEYLSYEEQKTYKEIEKILKNYEKSLDNRLQT